MHSFDIDVNLKLLDLLLIGINNSTMTKLTLCYHFIRAGHNFFSRPMELEAQGCQRCPLSKPLLGQNIALHVVPAYRASAYLVSASPTHPISSSPKCLQSSAVECVLSSDSELLLIDKEYIYLVSSW